jgi:two-component system, OmpR family, phosphate regulon response regulator PhoB
MKRLGHIIMADDNPNDVSLVSYAFQEAGLDNPVQWLATGEMLLHHLIENRASQQMPLLVVMDWKMPGANPLKILKWIRKQPEYLSLLIVVLTGSDSPLEKKLAYEAGANWHIVKSSNFTDLAQLVDRIRKFWLSTTGPEPSNQLSSR